MKIENTIGRLFVVVHLGLGLVVGSSAMAAPKAGGGSIVVEVLGTPAGAVSSRAEDVSSNGKLAVGDAYWNATIEQPNNWHAVRWTRDSGSGPWRVEDLRSLLPRTGLCRATHVNDVGTVVVYSQDATPGGPVRSYVLLASGGYTDLGPSVEVRDLNESDEMVGVRFLDGVDQPLYWRTPTSEPTQLPLLMAGYGGQATMLRGDRILGTATDANGGWLVQWTLGTGGWEIAPVLELAASFGMSFINSAGRISGSQSYQTTARAAIWDPPYVSPPINLPNPAGPYSWTRQVMETGMVTGLSVARNGVDMLPVVWPTPSTVVALPMVSRATGGTMGRYEGKRIAGSVHISRWGPSEAVLWTLP